MAEDDTQAGTEIHATLQAALGNLDRSANDSIRGYLTQVTYSALAWLGLQETEVLVVEGREDLDRILLDQDGRVQEFHETQIKDLTEGVNARSKPVWESIFNFLLSYRYHRNNGKSVRMLFATTARQKDQRTARSTAVVQTEEKTQLYLEIDVMKTWASLPDLDETAYSISVEQLARTVRGLFDANLRPLLPKPDATKINADARWAQDALTEIELHDAQSTWPEFFSSVFWLTEIGLDSDLAEQLKSRIAEDARMSALPADEFAQLLIYRVLVAAAKSDVTQRFLTRGSLQEIVASSADSLRQWAHDQGLVNLVQWQRLTEETLSEHGERITVLESEFAAAQPTPERDWPLIQAFTQTVRQRVRIDIGGVHLPRQTQLTALGETLQSAGVVVLLGASGAGKSALVRNYSEDLDTQGGLTLWLAGSSLDRPDLAALQSDMKLENPIGTIFEAYPGPRTLVFDGLDRVYESQSLALVADLLHDLKVGQTGALCKVVVTCQTSDWPGLEDRLEHERIDVSGWVLQECPPPVEADLEPIWESIPAAQHIAHEPRLAALMKNLKILDLVASRIAAGDGLDVQRFVGESSVASWFWRFEVAKSSQRRSREAFVMQLGELQADFLRPSTSLTDLPGGGTSVIDGLEADRVCVVDERSHVLFAHDLYADWARLRALKTHSQDLAEYLQPRLVSPLWHRAIRLLGGEFLDERSDVDGWKTLLRSLQEVGGESAGDLLLESIFFAANAPSHLALLADEILSERGLLDRLLGRFLAFATLPDPAMRIIGHAVGLSDMKVSSRFRYPNWPYWPAVLTFLHIHRAQVTKIAPRRVAQVVKLWLEHTPPDTILRREAGELGLMLGRLALDARRDFRDERGEFFAVALAGVPECEEEVIAFALEVSERTTEQRQDRPSRSMSILMHPDFDPNEPMPDPYPDGPHNRVDEDFQDVAFTGQALIPLMRQRPAIAREIILACLLASRHRGEWYRHDDSDQWRIDLAFVRTSWSLPCYFRGPFANLLKTDFAEGLETIARLVDFVAKQWVERRQRGREGGQLFNAPESVGVLQADVAGVPQTFLGDVRIFGWSAGLGSPFPSKIVTSALMALEHHLYEVIAADGDIASLVRAVLERTQSVPMLLVLLDVGRKEPSLFEGPLMPLLGIVELYSWEILVRSQSRSHLEVAACLEGEYIWRMLHEFNSLPHRNYDLRHLASELFLDNEDVSRFLTAKAVEWGPLVAEPQAARNKEILEQLILMFNKDNYKQVNHEGEQLVYVNTALQERDAARRDEQTARNEASSLDMFPFRCRRLLDNQLVLTEDDLPAFVMTLKRTEIAWKAEVQQTPSLEDGEASDLTMEPADISDAQANILAGGIAVLLCLHYDWVTTQPGLLDWCRESLSMLMLNPPPRVLLDVHDSSANWHWDCFAAEAIVALWQRNPEDLVIRKLVAVAAFSYHNLAVSLLMKRAEEMLPTRLDDFQRLRRLVFEHAFLRKRIDFRDYQIQYNAQVGEDEIQTASKQLDSWFDQQVEAFVEGHLEAPTSDWMQMDSTALFSHLDANRPGVLNGYWLDFKLVRAAHETACRLETAGTEEERAYRLWFLKRALDFWVSIIKEERWEYEHRYPDDDARWLLNQLAAAISAMRPEENPEEIWTQIIALPTQAHHWSDVFLNAFYRQNLTADPVPEAFVHLANDFIQHTLGLPAEQQWESREDTWQALFGIQGYTHELWQARHATAAASLWSALKEWVAQHRLEPRNLAAVARWLITEAATNLRLDGISVLRDHLNPSDSWWPSHDSKFAEDAVAELLQVVWDEQEAIIRQSAEVQAAFQAILRWLAERQHSLGLEIMGRIGRL